MKKVHFNQIPYILSAELPDQNEDRSLYGMVIVSMLHGPSGAMNRNHHCTKDSMCNNIYSRVFLQETETDEDEWKRKTEDGGFQANINDLYEVDNKWIVPSSFSF